jgi:putative endonuclease
MHFRERHCTFYVYIMTNRSKTLYIGVTSNLEKRVWQHKEGVFEGFTSKYKLDR